MDVGIVLDDVQLVPQLMEAAKGRFCIYIVLLKIMDFTVDQVFFFLMFVCHKLIYIYFYICIFLLSYYQVVFYVIRLLVLLSIFCISTPGCEKKGNMKKRVLYGKRLWKVISTECSTVAITISMWIFSLFIKTEIR